MFEQTSLRSILLCLLLIACGEGSSKKKAYTDSIPLVEAQGLSSFNGKVNLDSLTPEGLGLLLTKRLGSYGTCTAFMVSEKVALTNSHCVEGLKDGESCEGKIAIQIKTGDGQEFVSCKKVLKASATTYGSFVDPDYAVLELSKSLKGIKFKPLSRDGIEDDETVTIESINSISIGSGWINGEYKRSTCVAKTDSMVGNFSQKKSTIVPVFPMNDQMPCHIIPGNSGSPVVNSKGKVVAVVFASKKDQQNIVLVPGTIDIKAITDFAITTNLSCLKVNLAEYDEQIDPACDLLMKEEANYKKNLTEKIQKKSYAEVTAKMEKLVETLPSGFEYTSEFKNNVLKFMPKCFRPLDKWKASDLKNIKMTGLFRNKKDYQVSIPYFSVTSKPSFDQYFRMSVIMTTETLEMGYVRTNNLDKTMEQGHGKITKVYNVLGTVLAIDEELPVCAKTP
jgi:hypothetical protein